LLRRSVVPLLLVSVLAVAGCGSSKSSSVSAGSGGANTVHLAKTKFVIHTGLAFGAFHRWIYKPFRAGDFSHPFSHKLAIVKAGLAGAFVLHEIRIARVDAAHSKLLSRVVLPLLGVYGTVQLIRSALSHHQAPSSADINKANSQVSTAESASKAAGQPITETTAGAHI
jgi:hypothetical protein